jgi:hypothetical protein
MKRVECYGVVAVEGRAVGASVVQRDLVWLQHQGHGIGLAQQTVLTSTPKPEWHPAEVRRTEYKQNTVIPKTMYNNKKK